jgi:hypothetical protein
MTTHYSFHVLHNAGRMFCYDISLPLLNVKSVLLEGKKDKNERNRQPNIKIRRGELRT